MGRGGVERIVRVWLIYFMWVTREQITKYNTLGSGPVQSSQVDELRGERTTDFVVVWRPPQKGYPLAGLTWLWL